MRIVADENMPLVQEFFGDIGDIVQLPGRKIAQAHLKKADILLVRSVTPVTESLLADSPVKFVGSATIGTDHVDQEFLHSAGIGFSNAPGCNASAVVEYVLSCLTLLSIRQGFLLRDMKVGIVGVGNIGQQLSRVLGEIGVTCLHCDPPREEAGDPGHWLPLDELIRQSDIITLHTPLTRKGRHATYHLFDKKRIDQLASGQVLINTSRGAVVDNKALGKRLKQRPGPAVILDVWENEPRLSSKLLKRVVVGTPHIAGYSLDGRCRGTEMVYRAMSRQFGLPVRKKLGQFLPQAPVNRLGFTAAADPARALHTAVRVCYDVAYDDASLRTAIAKGNRNGEAFDQLRRNYPLRRGFRSLKIRARHVPGELQKSLSAMGFRMEA